MDIPAIVEALFGRKMTEPAAREMANEIRARCRDTTQAEVKAAFRALADRHGDQANRALPTAPEVAREVWAARKAPKQLDAESVEDGLIAIGEEPCQCVRWSMLVNRGQPAKLVEAIKASGIELAPWNKANPDFGLEGASILPTVVLDIEGNCLLTVSSRSGNALLFFTLFL